MSLSEWDVPTCPGSYFCGRNLEEGRTGKAKRMLYPLSVAALRAGLSKERVPQLRASRDIAYICDAGNRIGGPACSRGTIFLNGASQVGPMPAKKRPPGFSF